MTDTDNQPRYGGSLSTISRSVCALQFSSGGVTARTPLRVTRTAFNLTNFSGGTSILVAEANKADPPVDMNVFHRWLPPQTRLSVFSFIKSANSIQLDV